MARTKTNKAAPKAAPTTDFTIRKQVNGCIRFNSGCIAELALDMEAGTISGRIHDDTVGKSYTVEGTITEEE